MLTPHVVYSSEVSHYDRIQILHSTSLTMTIPACTTIIIIIFSFLGSSLPLIRLFTHTHSLILCLHLSPLHNTSMHCVWFCFVWFSSSHSSSSTAFDLFHSHILFWLTPIFEFSIHINFSYFRHSSCWRITFLSLLLLLLFCFNKYLLNNLDYYVNYYYFWVFFRCFNLVSHWTLASIECSRFCCCALPAHKSVRINFQSV